ncbi:4Fe-4S dicluster domain-containing protein [Sulfurimonas aquatica]|uniref:NADH-quinone oxidoreductase subunit I n=1 Tax=Sulfurimonas aquatica TaxID=2672570 RepID=A0A975AZF1_9BACT|nr:NADH-quinone oxidoreductase subunit I [Sulfurimonas aquatica]QSZ41397.1 4Fe-4S dicluster domain-containing protein [Sulfurimonas aquatica]
MSQNVKVVQRASSSVRDKLYLPAIYDGMKITFKHFFKNLSDINAVDVLRYPEEQPQDITDRYRGLHRLTHRPDDSIACVACFMCATACPSNCMFIEAQEREDGHDEKMPKSFSIDTLECIFCGYCVEACPCDAIRMDTGIFSLTGNKREDFVLDKEQLLANKGAFGEVCSCARD